MKSFLNFTVIAGFCLSLLVALSGCREEEQGRVLMYKKGEYLGAADSALDGKTLDTLSQRSRLQAYD
jgi:hypothetical protein